MILMTAGVLRLRCLQTVLFAKRDTGPATSTAAAAASAKAEDPPSVSSPNTIMNVEGCAFSILDGIYLHLHTSRTILPALCSHFNGADSVNAGMYHLVGEGLILYYRW